MNQQRAWALSLLGRHQELQQQAEHLGSELNAVADVMQPRQRQQLHLAQAEWEQLQRQLQQLEGLRHMLIEHGLEAPVPTEMQLYPVLSARAAQERTSRIPGLEQEVRDWVAGLQRWGILTLQSGAGHPRQGLPYPWVQIQSAQVGRLGLLLERFPLPEWEVWSGPGGPRLQPQVGLEPRQLPLPEGPERQRLLQGLPGWQQQAQQWGRQLLGGEGEVGASPSVGSRIRV